MYVSMQYFIVVAAGLFILSTVALIRTARNRKEILYLARQRDRDINAIRRAVGGIDERIYQNSKNK